MKKLFLLLGLLACSSATYAAKINEDLAAIEEHISGRIGVSVWDTQTMSIGIIVAMSAFP